MGYRQFEKSLKKAGDLMQRLDEKEKSLRRFYLEFAREELNRVFEEDRKLYKKGPARLAPLPEVDKVLLRSLRDSQAAERESQKHMTEQLDAQLKLARKWEEFLEFQGGQTAFDHPKDNRL